jgi:hypothetical protein
MTDKEGALLRKENLCSDSTNIFFKDQRHIEIIFLLKIQLRLCFS